MPACSVSPYAASCIRPPRARGGCRHGRGLPGGPGTRRRVCGGGQAQHLVAGARGAGAPGRCAPLGRHRLLAAVGRGGLALAPILAARPRRAAALVATAPAGSQVDCVAQAVWPQRVLLNARRCWCMVSARGGAAAFLCNALMPPVDCCQVYLRRCRWCATLWRLLLQPCDSSQPRSMWARSSARRPHPRRTAGRGAGWSWAAQAHWGCSLRTGWPLEVRAQTAKPAHQHGWMAVGGTFLRLPMSRSRQLVAPPWPRRAAPDAARTEWSGTPSARRRASRLGQCSDCGGL